jgi:hypothetical protein
MPKSVPTADKLAKVELFKGVGAVTKAANAAWGVSRKAPMFQKKVDGSKTKRALRVINLHAFKTAASGAAAYAADVFRKEAKVLRVQMGTAKRQIESKRVPWAPRVSPGAVMALETFLISYAQQATRAAMVARQGLGTKEKPLYTRLNGKLMTLGFDTADAAIFSGCVPAPRQLALCDVKKKKKRAKAERCGETSEAEPERDL